MHERSLLETSKDRWTIRQVRSHSANPVAADAKPDILPSYKGHWWFDGFGQAASECPEDAKRDSCKIRMVVAVFELFDIQLRAWHFFIQRKRGVQLHPHSARFSLHIWLIYHSSLRNEVQVCRCVHSAEEKAIRREGGVMWFRLNYYNGNCFVFVLSFCGVVPNVVLVFLCLLLVALPARLTLRPLLTSAVWWCLLPCLRRSRTSTT